NRSRMERTALLDRTVLERSDEIENPSPLIAPDTDALAVDARAGAAELWRRPLSWLKRATGYFVPLTFSSLTRRIVTLNVAGLAALAFVILSQSQFRAGLIDARAQSLLVQAEIIARAIAATGATDSNTITFDPDKLLDLKTGESYGPTDDMLSGIDFP